ncbi:MAG: tetratricopeptide repeat protein [Deltaproteobacteria bacterium]|nr:tetratricopeptide repeat protein [Deltaproteobacteria bacterium]
MRWIEAGLIAAILSLPLVAAAQDEAAPTEEDETARIHFQSARAHFDSGRYEDALGEFERAYELSGHTDLLYNIGMSHERLGHYAEAADALEGFNQAQDEPDPEMTERVANLRHRAAERDAATAAAAAQAAEPGPEPVVEEPASGGGIPMGAIVSYGVAGAGLVTFAIFGALALAEDASLAGSCGADAGMSCSDDEVGTVQTFALVADIGLGVAVVGAIVGTVLLLVGGNDDEATVAIAPAIGPTTVGLAAAGSF